MLRNFPAREAADLLKLNYNTFRTYRSQLQDQMPTGTVAQNRRRYFTIEEIHKIRRVLRNEGKTDPKAFPKRQNDEPCVAITVLNPWKASDTSSSSAHIAANLGLLGYRVLCCDLDPQASLANMFGVAPELSPDMPTVYDMIRAEKPVPAHKVIQKTHIPTVDLIPASLSLMKFGYEAFSSQGKEVPTGSFYTRISSALKPVLPSYDVVIFNTPSQFSFAVISALFASRGVLISFEASAQEVSSLARYMSMIAKRMDLIKAYELDYNGPDFVRLLISCDEKYEQSHRQAIHFLRVCLGRSVMSAEFLYSNTVSDAGASRQTVFEVDPRDIPRKSYIRLIKSISKVTEEIEKEIFKVWGRTDGGVNTDKLSARVPFFRSIRGLT